jgi:cyclohexanecarboxylate-CoA ligase
VSIGELIAAAGSVAAELDHADVRPGDRVLVALPTSLRFVAAYLAIRARGAVFVNVPWQWRRELVAVAEETDARAVFLGARALDDRALSALAPRAHLPPSRALPATPPVAIARGPDEVAWLAYSSGTTGSPKGAVHTERTLGLIPQGFCRRYDLEQAESILVAAPVGHAVGFVYGVALALYARRPMVLVPRWDVETAAALVERHRCAFTAAPTPFLLDVVAHAERGFAKSFASLRHFLSGGASVPRPLLDRARQVLPDTQTSAYYGTSECGAVTSCPPDAPLAKRLGTEGLPLPGMEVCAEEGQLLVRGTQVARGYWGEDRDGRFRADGWYATGDLASIDDSGYVSFTGRLGQVIRRGGVNVAPDEVERILAAAPGVRHVLVFALPDVRLGELVAAAVIPQAAPPALEDLRDECERQGLARVKWPQQLFVLDELPKSASGKPSRTLTAELVSGR